MASFRKTTQVAGQDRNVEDTKTYNNIQKAEKHLHEYQTHVEIQVKRSFTHPNGANIRRNLQIFSDLLARVFNECKKSGDFTRFYSILGRFRQQWRQNADRIGFLKKQKMAQQYEMLRRRAAWVEMQRKSAFNARLGAKQTIVAPGICAEYPIVVERRGAEVARASTLMKPEAEVTSNNETPSGKPTRDAPTCRVEEWLRSTATQQDPVQLRRTPVQHTPNKLKRGRPSNALLDRLASSIHNEDLTGLMREASETRPTSSQRCSKYRKIAENGSGAIYQRVPEFILVTKPQDVDESDEDYTSDEE
ncbi:hypothetical protein HII31_02871 [Pseudocercospora fuligena]|uniref:Uncharacterized protein n=1 Tax=Pseudocercospora fuligena TaxID=685502 RepID=A0A8H6VPL1_9PEZI|nr:hypothetical protein HII31_02871 [Pseudocercospora fuligena]